MAEFRERGCDVLGISTDSVGTHERWLETSPAQGGLGGLNFPLAGDEDGAACRAYGGYAERQHLALRGLCLIDPNGVLQYQVVHSLTVGRNTEEILRVLEGLQMGGLCPGERRRGEPALDATRELGPNRVIGPYRVEAELGGGSFGTVFRARDLTLDREVALKVLRPGGPVPPAAPLGRAPRGGRREPPQRVHYPCRRFEPGRPDDRHGIRGRPTALPTPGGRALGSEGSRRTRPANRAGNRGGTCSGSGAWRPEAGQ